MATQASPSHDSTTEAGAPAAKSSFLAKINVLLFLLVVIVAECLIAYFYLPSAADTAAMAGAPAAPKEQKEDGHGEHAAAEEKPDGQPHGQIEVDLGEFSVTAYQPVSNSTLRIDFHLYGTIGAESEQDFAKLMEENKHRFREQVLVIVRSADITDLTDAGLGLVKRKIQEKTNRILSKPLLRSIIVSDFSFVEQ